MRCSRLLIPYIIAIASIAVGVGLLCCDFDSSIGFALVAGVSTYSIVFGLETISTPRRSSVWFTGVVLGVVEVFSLRLILLVAYGFLSL